MWDTDSDDEVVSFTVPVTGTYTISVTGSRARSRIRSNGYELYVTQSKVRHE